ncbi:MAG: tyrosine-protein phosphatase, partial [Desulfobacterales bacterium]
MKPDDFSITVLTVVFFILLAVVPVLAQPISGSAAGTLPQLPPGQSLGIALSIPTVPNLRDVGGYKTRDGAIVARGLAYRSDTFNPMTAEDIKKLGRLDLKNDYD